MSGDRKKSVSTPIKLCSCVECHSKGTRKSKKKKSNGEKEKRNKKKQTKSNKKNSKKMKKSIVQSQSQPINNISYDLNVDEDDDIDDDIGDQHSVDDHQSEGGDSKSSVINHDLLPGSCSSCPSLCDHSQDYGYASAENNNHSNTTSSPDGSDVACSEGFCNHLGNLTVLV